MGDFLGFGTWPLAGDNNGTVSYGRVDVLDSIEALEVAYSGGIKLYDTADFYGYGFVEELLGRVLGSVRNNIKIISKVGLLKDGTSNYSPEYIRRSLNGSLHRLQTTYLDYYMLHSPSIEDVNEDTVGCLVSLVGSGVVHSWGISARTPADALIFVNRYRPHIIETNFNMLDMRALNIGLLDKGITIVGRTPLAQGLLTNKFEFNNDSADSRNNWGKEETEKKKQIFNKMLGVLDPIDTALRFCISYEGISHTIPGMKTKQEVLQNINAVKNGPLSKNTLKHIENVYELSGWK